MFLREYRKGMYSYWTYYIVQNISEVPMVMIEEVIKNITVPYLFFNGRWRLGTERSESIVFVSMRSIRKRQSNVTGTVGCRLSAVGDGDGDGDGDGPHRDFR